MIIVGAGMAGLLAAAMLRNECSTIIESQSELPNNHSAVLRFRSSVVGDTLNIPFRKVKVMKAVAYQPGSNPVADMMRYSFKTNGSYTLRSPIDARGELEDRWIAPPDLVQQMADRVMCPIEYDTDFDDHWNDLGTDKDNVISTLPMPVLMNILGYDGPRPEFRSVPGFNINFDLNSWSRYECDAHVSLYVPNSDVPFSRVSITGSRVTIEFQFPLLDRTEVEQVAFAEQHHQWVALACQMLGNLPLPGTWETKMQAYAKILPVDDASRKRFMLWATETHQVYSLGRFATWRPGLLLDDLVKDVRVIMNIAQQGTYEQRR